MRFTILCLLLVAAILSGCAATIRDLSKTQYLNPELSPESLRAGGLALLPITAGQGQEGYRRPLGDLLNSQIANAVPGGVTLTWQSTMDSLNHHGKVPAYEELIAAYRTTSILNRDRVRELSSALGVRYALYCSLEDFSETSQTSYSAFSGVSTSKSANVAAHCLLMDLETGDVMQEIAGQANSVAGEFEYNLPYEDLAATLAYSVLSRIPGSSVPSKPPKQTGRSQTKAR